MATAPSSSVSQRALALAPYIVCFVVHAVSSISLTLLNKRISEVAPGRPFAVLLAQNSGGAVILAVGWALGLVPVHAVSGAHLRPLIGPAVCFVGVLSTSLIALRQVAVPLVVVVRNMTPLATLALEVLLLRDGAAPTASRIGALSVTVVGSALYSRGETSWTNVGLALLVANMFFSALMAILEARMSRVVHQTAAGLIIYRFAASTPLLLGLVLLADSEPVDFLPHRWGDGVALLLAVTSLLSTTFGLAVMRLTQLGVRPTTILTANSSYKLLTTVLGIYFFPVEVPSHAWLGYALSTVGYIIYATRPKGDQYKPKCS